MDDNLRRDAAAYGVGLSDDQLAQFAHYQEMLTEWSGRMNLVGDADADTVRSRHFLESIALGATLRERELLRPGADVLEVGAGAGFPGIVLKIVWPAIRLTLIEATAKKTAFLLAVVDALALEGTAVITGRAETHAHDPALRGRFDLVVARAVAHLAALAEITLPFARIGGRVVTPKGSRAQEEIEAAKGALAILHGRIFAAPLRVAGPPQTLVAIIKTAETPPEYPRRPGVPGKSPL